MIILQLIHVNDKKITYILINPKYSDLIIKINGKNLQGKGENVDELYHLLGGGVLKVSPKLGIVIDLTLTTHLKKCNYFSVFWYD